MNAQTLPSNPQPQRWHKARVATTAIWNASRAIWISGWSRRNLRYAVMWLLGFGTGIWVLIALAQRSTSGGRYAWEKGGQWLWLSQVLDWLSNAPSDGSYDFVNALSSWLIVWTLLLCTVWLYLRPIQTHPCRQARLRYLIIWIVGIVALVPGLQKLMTIVVPIAASSLTQFTTLFPLVVIWTTCIFLLFLYIGDNSDAYPIYLEPYRAIWTVLALVMLGAVLTGYAAYQGVRARVDGHLSARTMARKTVQQLQLSTTATLNYAQEMAARIDSFETTAQEIRRHAAQDPSAGDASTTQAIVQARMAMLEDLLHTIPDVEQQASSASVRAEAARRQLTLAEKQQKGPLVDSLPNIAAVLEETSRSTATLTPTIGTIAMQLEGLHGETAEQVSLEDLRTLITRDLIGPAQDANTNADVLARSLAGVDFSGLAIFLWIGAVYVVLVLFPWMLHLLFLYRKRRNRAAQILEDLTRLDPSHNLLHRILCGYTAQNEQDQRELRRLLQRLKPGESLSDDLDRYVEAVANRAFSNLEYLLSLIVLSLLIAVGWYYVFYPQTSLGLAELIEQGAGVKELSTYIVDNLTPLTLSFAGAYFFIMQMLVRRYLADDLYPSAFTQAAQRILLVFILSLAVSILASQSIIEVLTNLKQGQPPTTSTPLILLLAAFFVGIYPRSGLRLATTLVNKLLQGMFGINRRVFPETLVPEPLTLLAGVTVWNEARLLEENVENVQSMATVPIEQLVVGTHFSTAQIVDWVDQAILHLHAGHNGEWFCPLRSVGIRSAYALLDAATAKPVTTAMLCQELQPEPACLERIVRAVKTASSTVICPNAEPGTSTRPAVPQAPPAPAAPANGRPPELTIDILHEIFDTIWQHPNMRYIVEFHHSCPGSPFMSQVGAPASL